MEILSAVLVGVTVGLLAGLRVVRLRWAFGAIGTALVAICVFLAVSAGPNRTSQDWERSVSGMMLIGPGFAFYMIFPGAVIFGLIRLFRWAGRSLGAGDVRLNHPDTQGGESVRRFRLTMTGAACSGVLYLLYALGLLYVSQEVGRDVLRQAGLNTPATMLMLLFGFEDSVKAAPWLEAAYYITVGTMFYASMGGTLGYIYAVLVPGRGEVEE